MNRSLLVLLALTGAATVAGINCNSPTCGAGTKQVQQANGDLNCVPVDKPAAEILCDADAGAAIVAGKCVSAISCGPNTTLNATTGQCEGSGGGMMAHTPTSCSTPMSGTVCVNGVVRHLLDNSYLATGEKVRVAVYDPLAFLGDPSTTPLAEIETDDVYTFNNVPLGFTQLLVLAVADATGTTTKMLQLTATGVKGVAGQSYQVDAYSTPVSAVSAWTTQSGNMDYDKVGAYVMKFYLDAAPPATKLTATETMPAAGVTAGTNDSNTFTASTKAHYFGAALTTVDPAATVTSAIGAAILPGTGDSSILNYSGMGAGQTWEIHPGNTTAHVVFVDRFHPCTMDSMGKCIPL